MLAVAAAQTNARDSGETRARAEPWRVLHLAGNENNASESKARRRPMPARLNQASMYRVIVPSNRRQRRSSEVNKI